MMILGFKNKKLKAFYKTDTIEGVKIIYTQKLRRILDVLNVAYHQMILND